MGELNLGMAFDGVPRMLRDQVNTDTFTATGQTRTFTGVVADTHSPLRVTLAWTDAPGSTTAASALNNDLDLTVSVGGIAYFGNAFSGAYTIAGGSPDRKNNVESVFLPPGTSGPFAVTITAASINSDGVPNQGPSLDQDFALVMYNGVLPPAGPPTISALVSNEEVVLTWDSVPGRLYRVEYQDTVAGGAWVNASADLTATNLITTLRVPFGPDGSRFFRVALLP
jgi:hypothetical protein